MSTVPLPRVASPRAGAAVTGWVFRTENMCGPWELQERVLLRKIAGTGHGHERAWACSRGRWVGEGGETGRGRTDVVSV